GNRIVRGALLILIGVENRGTVAGPDVVALTVSGGRIVNLEEELQQLSIADFLRIENDLDRLGVGPVIAIGRVGHVAAGVADARGDHARVFANEVLHPPKAAAGEHGTFRRSCHIESPLSRSGRPDSNRRRPAWEAGILPTELRPRRRVSTRPIKLPTATSGINAGWGNSPGNSVYRPGSRQLAIVLQLLGFRSCSRPSVLLSAE